MPGTLSKSVSLLARLVKPWLCISARIERIATKEAMLTAQIACQENVLGRHRQHMNAGSDNVIQSQPKTLELLDLGRMLSEPLSDSFVWPSKTLAGFEGHQPMGGITEQGG